MCSENNAVVSVTVTEFVFFYISVPVSSFVNNRFRVLVDG
jgi:hypothetical protein